IGITARPWASVLPCGAAPAAANGGLAAAPAAADDEASRRPCAVARQRIFAVRAFGAAFEQGACPSGGKTQAEIRVGGWLGLAFHRGGVYSLRLRVDRPAHMGCRGGP